MDDTGLKGENWVHRRTRQLHDQTYPRVVAGQPLGDEGRQMCGELLTFGAQNRAYMEKLLEKAEKTMTAVPAGRRDFYQAHVLTQIQIHLAALAALETYCRTLNAYEAGDKPKAVLLAEETVRAFDRVYPELHKAEYGKWAGWYEGECFTGLERTRCRLENMVAALKGMPEPVKSERWEEFHYTEVYQYQERFGKNFPLLYPAKPSPPRPQP